MCPFVSTIHVLFSRMASSPYSQGWSGAAAVLPTGSTVKKGGHTDRPSAESGRGTAFVAVQTQDLQVSSRKDS